ncbi:hypothetical protein A2392_02925 [Candidatus Kaiserbacteria bacterium RIFOXYB1_FULL_46_14]|uniref:TrbC/VIRB2 family protein n=1 Tax=Candidatus Kaiserbacteria bacterium RIFOXYB1_FULL_46_14 TaxID=1798531 RepID=A0A1F6FIQ9_9BACT|nr:MAG: hypothetical protein A2392_02925 [Candidatus Kaiserbacteria bacterium RIFOXYB1_FULL_46_14]
MRFLPFLLALFIVFLPTFVGAAESTGLVPCDGTDCDTGDVIQLANNLIDFLIKMLSVIAVIALVYVGFQLVVSAGDTSKWSEAKEMFTNIVIGIIIILSAFLVVDLLLKGLTDKGLDETTGGITNTGNTTN